MNSNFTLTESTSSTRLIPSQNKHKIIADRHSVTPITSTSSNKRISSQNKQKVIADRQSVTPIISTTNENNKERVIGRGFSVVRKGIPISEFKQYVKNSFSNGEFEKQHKVRKFEKFQRSEKKLRF